MKAGMKAVFAGTPEFAREALAALHAAGVEIPLVLTQPDRPAGRGMKLQASPVKQYAQAHGMAVAQPHSLRLDGKYPDEAAAARELLQGTGADVMVVAAYGLILPKWTLELPRLGCLNIHASLLPRWRGAAPIHRAIEAGDAETGITIMQMDEGLDTGDMLLVEPVAITPEDTTATLHDRLAALGGRLIVQALRQVAGGTLPRVPQPAEGVTYAHKIEKAEAAIDWRLPAQALERRIRAFDPFPGATFGLPAPAPAAPAEAAAASSPAAEPAEAAETVKVWRASVEDRPGAPGQVLQAEGDTLVVACGAQALALHALQRPGGRRVSTREFLHSLRTAPTHLR